MVQTVLHGLEITPDLYLPLKLGVETLAILAQRGAGKTYLGRKIAEAMVRAGLQTLIFDPLSVWWGLRMSADGLEEGLPIAIIGGPHGDLPLRADQGAAVAHALAESGKSAVLDLSQLKKAERAQFAGDFAEAIFHRKQHTALHLILDEADMFVPQQPNKGEQAMLEAFDDVVRRGRVFGLGVTLISQRSAVINKDLLSQAAVLFALRTTGTNDRKAIDDWLKGHLADDQRRAVLDSLAGLPTGDAWICSAFYQLFEHVHVGELTTFDSSSTPEVGALSSVLAVTKVDVAAIQALLGTAESPPADAPVDDRELRRLRSQLQQMQADLAAKNQRLQAVTVWVDRLADGYELLANAHNVLGELNDLITAIRGQMLISDVDVLNPLADGDTVTTTVQILGPVSTPAAKPKAAPPVPATTGLITAAKKLLRVLAQHHPARLTMTQLVTLADYEITGGGFRGGMKQLREQRLVVEDGPKVFLSADAVALMGVGSNPGLTPSELRAIWEGALPASSRKILAYLVSIWPDTIFINRLATTLGYQVTGGGFRGGMKALRDNELVETDGDRVRAANLLIGERLES